jgi:ubiquitin carboxyl-terminal hydrolase 36/42
MVCNRFRPGSQQDAHEFLRILLDKAHMANLDGLSEKQAGQKRVRSTVVYQHFGGILRSSVTCKECRHVSATDDVLLDLPLDIYDRNVVSLQTALRMFAAVEQLEPNTYMCEKCKKRVSATKKFRVEVLPQYLTIQLKRFGFGTTKIGKGIEFPINLNMRDAAGESFHPADCQYHLCGVLVHFGATQCGGHYKAYVRSSQTWFEADDSNVREVDKSQVLNQRQGAYLLFYERMAVPTRMLRSLLLSVSQQTPDQHLMLGAS